MVEILLAENCTSNLPLSISEIIKNFHLEILGSNLPLDFFSPPSNFLQLYQVMDLMSVRRERRPEAGSVLQKLLPIISDVEAP